MLLLGGDTRYLAQHCHDPLHASDTSSIELRHKAKKSPAKRGLVYIGQSVPAQCSTSLVLDNTCLEEVLLFA